MKICIAQESDLPELAKLYQQTVLEIAPQKYSPIQTEAWAFFATEEGFRDFILKPTTFLAVDTTGILAFFGIESDGHIASAYVRRDRVRQGIGATLIQTLLDHAKSNNIKRLYAEASEFSVALFQKSGFHLYDTEVVDRQGVDFKRYLVELS